MLILLFCSILHHYEHAANPRNWFYKSVLSGGNREALHARIFQRGVGCRKPTNLDLRHDVVCDSVLWPTESNDNGVRKVQW